MSALLFVIAILVTSPLRAADAGFARWLEATWPEVERQGVTRPGFDAATRGLEPDLTLPDLVIPGRPDAPQKGQAEFIQSPADYVRESTIERLATQGRKLAAHHRGTLARIEEAFGVPGPVVLAIWGRETAYGGQKLPHDAVRVLATQAYLGRRKEQFRGEFILALKMLDQGVVSRAAMKSSWAGAMGLTQFLPSDYYRHGVDFDRDGKVDIWTSVPDALASTAKQLVEKGWKPGYRWAHEVRAPANVDCTRADPDNRRPIRDWIADGFAPAYDEAPSPAAQAQPASLLLPAGTYGPAFLVAANYFAIKDYNFSDLYVLFVGHLSDRIGNPRPFETPWAKVVQLETKQVEAMQKRLTELGLYSDKLDGKAGMRTRLALGAYQKRNGLKLDCWPTAAVVAHMQKRAGAR